MITQCACRTLAEQLNVLEVTTLIKHVHLGVPGILSRCNDGHLYLLRAFPEADAEVARLHEYLGSFLLERLGLSALRAIPAVVKSSVIRVAASHSDSNLAALVTEWSPGLYLAMRMPDLQHDEILECVPPTWLQKINNSGDLMAVLVFDIWANLQAERRCIYRKLYGTGQLEVIFVDNSDLFGGANGTPLNAVRRQPLNPSYRKALRENAQIEFWVSHLMNEAPDILDEGFASLPPAWNTPWRRALESSLIRRLQRLDDLVQYEFN